MFIRVAPVFATIDVIRALGTYEKLGFAVDAFTDGSGSAIYGFMRRAQVELHIARVPYIDKKTTNVCCYLYVEDADVLFAEWSEAAVSGTLHKPTNTSYGLREFAFVDDDGNLIRVGSPLSE